MAGLKIIPSSLRSHSDNLETDVEQIHQIFLYGILEKRNHEFSLILIIVSQLAISHPNQLYILIQGVKSSI